MSIVLPTWPGPAEAEPAYMDFGTTMDGGPHGGGPRIHRLGNRFSLAVTMPRSKMEPQHRRGVGARVFLSRLRQAMAEGAIYPWPQPGLAIGTPGAPLIDGDTGPNVASLNLKGMRSGYVIREGQFFNVYRADGRAMLHHAAAEVQVGADGRAAVPILPRTRSSLPNGSTVNMIPVIQGRISGDQQSWNISTAWTTAVSFTIAEYGNNE